MTVEPLAPLDLQEIFYGIDALAIQRPVAARIVQLADAADTSAKQLGDMLMADVVLASRVMRLANSAYFGMRGRVTSLQLAVTVVGFTSVRTMATVALTDPADESGLPEDFWTVSTQLAVAAARLAPAFGERPADALCLGLLAQLGSALLFQYDAEGYQELRAAEPSFPGQRRAEAKRYGITAVELTAIALETWGFPDSLLLHLRRMDDRTSVAGGLLRACYEVVSRLTIPDHRPSPIGPVTQFKVRDENLPEILYAVLNESEDLRRMLIGD